MNASERYEIIAATFGYMTGHFPPGKDAGPGMQTEDQRAEAREAWPAWYEKHGACINFVIDAVLQSIEKQ